MWGESCGEHGSRRWAAGRRQRVKETKGQVLEVAGSVMRPSVGHIYCLSKKKRVLAKEKTEN